MILMIVAVIVGVSVPLVRNQTQLHPFNHVTVEAVSSLEANHVLSSLGNTISEGVI
jgi:hypothetical protein